jgi:hypothetical protein
MFIFDAIAINFDNKLSNFIEIPVTAVVLLVRQTSLRGQPAWNDSSSIMQL